MKKLAIALLAAPLLLAASIYGIGAMLPRDHVARAEKLIASSRPQVAAIVRDVTGQPRWRSAVERIEPVEREGGRLRYVEFSGGDAITFDFVEERPDALFRSTIADPSLPFSGSWTIALADAQGGTRVTIEERGSVSDPLYRFFSALIFGHEGTMRTYLDDLAARARA